MIWYIPLWWALSLAGTLSCAASTSLATSEPTSAASEESSVHASALCSALTAYPQTGPSGDEGTSAARSSDGAEAHAADTERLYDPYALGLDTGEETLFDSRCVIYDDLRDQALLDAIYDEVSGHRALGYTIARDHMYGLREPVIDIFDGELECVYTGRPAIPDGTRTPERMNTEHSWPQSKGSKTEPARSDIHHLFISDQGVNSRRQNFEFGETSCNDPGEVECRWEGPDSRGTPSQLGFDERGERIFEVRTERRGDIARAQFYFSARYIMPIGPYTEDVLRAWHAEDAPDAREKERNRRIELVQGNRNPFIDCPDLVERITDF